MNNGIFESVQFLNEFNFGNLFKKKQRQHQSKYDNEEIELIKQKIVPLLTKNSSGLEKCFNQTIKNTNYKDYVNAYEFCLDSKDIYFENGTFSTCIVSCDERKITYGKDPENIYELGLEIINAFKIYADKKLELNFTFDNDNPDFAIFICIDIDDIK